MSNRCYRRTAVLALLPFLFLTLPTFSQKENADPLPSWKDGPAKKSIIDFVLVTTDKASPQYVPPEQRIATLDQDGTIWVEQPVVTQVMFAFDGVKALAAIHTEWKDKELFKAMRAVD